MRAGFDMIVAIDILLLAMLCAIACIIAASRSHLTSILLMGACSLITAPWLVIMDAPDVAFTQAVTGAAVSTPLMLAAVLRTGAQPARSAIRFAILPGLAVAGVGVVLVTAAAGLPPMGDPASPANSLAGRAYLAAAPADIGIPNVVTAIRANYRSLDTLGLMAIIVAAGVGVALILGAQQSAILSVPKVPAGDRHLILRVSAKLLIPLISLFAFYVQFHGGLGAGGGLEAGVIMAAGIVLYTLVFGLEEAQQALPAGLIRATASMGVLVYAGAGLVCILNGGNFLEYDHLLPPAVMAQIQAWVVGDASHHQNWGRYFGVMAAELGVFLSVAAAIIAVFYSIAGPLAAKAEKVDP